MFRASLETRNFHFETYDRTYSGAILALTDGLTEHARQYKLAGGWFFPGDIAVEEIEIGRVYRDRELMKGI